MDTSPAAHLSAEAAGGGALLAGSATTGAKSFLVTFVPGALQGASTVLLGHPLDTAKTRMQACGPNAQRSVVVTIGNMVRAEGLRSLFRGCSPPLLMEGMKRSLQFALWDLFRDAHSHQQLQQQRRLSGAPPVPAEAGLVPASRSAVKAAVAVIGANPFLSGAVAGGVGTTIGCPMHVIKIQTQYATKEGTRNAWTCTLDIFRREGLRGYYRGYRYNLLKDIFFAGTYLGIYGLLQQRWAPRPSSGAGAVSAAAVADAACAGADTTELAVGSGARAFLAGATASVVTWTLLYPLDTMKTLVQARQQHLLTAQLFQHPRQLYRGFAASLLKAGPVSGVSMCVYEFVKGRMDAWRDQDRLGPAE